VEGCRAARPHTSQCGPQLHAVNSLKTFRPRRAVGRSAKLVRLAGLTTTHNAWLRGGELQMIFSRIRSMFSEG
jgi:hypothetical protein